MIDKIIEDIYLDGSICEEEPDLLSIDLFRLRDSYIKNYGYLIVTKKLVLALKDYIGESKVLEVMAGTGYLSKKLKDNGVNIIATDNYSWRNKYTNTLEVENLDALSAIDKYGEEIDYVIMSWSPYTDTIDYSVLKKIRKLNNKVKLIVFTEGLGGCVGSDEFHENIIIVDEEHSDKINEAMSTWYFIHDRSIIVE